MPKLAVHNLAKDNHFASERNHAAPAPYRIHHPIPPVVIPYFP